VILECERAIPFAGEGFIFGKQIGDEEGFVGFDVVAQLELLHHVHDEQAFVAGIFGWVERFVQDGQCERALILKEFVRVEDFIHAIGDPLWVENAQGFKPWVVLKMQDNAQVMQEADERVLAGFIGDIVRAAQAEIFILRDEVLVPAEFLEFGFDREPRLRQQIADVRQSIHLFGDLGFERLDARACSGGCLKDANDVRIFLLQTRAVNVERMLVGLVADDQHRRLAAERLNDLEPVLDAVFLLRQARIQHQQVKTTLGEEELVCGVHDLLPTEVPNVEANRCISNIFIISFFSKHRIKAYDSRCPQPATD